MDEIMNEQAYKTLEFDKVRRAVYSHAHTTEGKEAVLHLLALDTMEEAVKAQKETAAALGRIHRKGGLDLSGVHPIGESLMRLKVGSSLSMKELLQIASLLRVTLRAKSYEKAEDAPNEEAGEEADALTEYFAALNPLVRLEKKISSCILAEDLMADDASPELKNIRRQMIHAREAVQNELQRIIQSKRASLQDGIVTVRGGRYCVPVRLESRQDVQGMIHDQSASGSTLFIEPLAVVQWNNKIRELEIEEEKEIRRILRELSLECAEYTEELKENGRLLVHLDIVFAKASYAKVTRSTEPVIRKDRILNLKKARHPLLDPKTVVPIDLTLGENFSQLIITGPNTGGKTVSLKTLGLLSLMTKAGLHIPAFDGSSVPWYEEIYADIGDEQSIEQSLSTFSSHMSNIVKILDKVTPMDLALFDELGAGTDPVEGAALGIAILRFLNRMRVSTLATTHYSELKVYALTEEGVMNASCEFDLKTLRPTYRLILGIPGKSNAFAISERLGLPSFFIEEAKRNMEKESEAFEDVISTLNAQKKELEEKTAEIQRLEEASRKESDKLKADRERFEARKEKLLEKAREDAENLLSETKEFMDKTIREVRDEIGSGALLSRLEERRRLVNEELKEKRGKKNTAPAPKSVPAEKKRPLRIGDRVFVSSLNMEGSVVSLPDASNHLKVQMGILTSRVSLKDVTLVNGGEVEEKKEHSSISKIRAGKSMTISPEINLIGMTVDEAMPRLSSYLDDAYLAKLPSARIVHGRGTGALKKAAHQLLRKTRYIDSFRLGVFGEGGDGVTIVQFKP